MRYTELTEHEMVQVKHHRKRINLLNQLSRIIGQAPIGDFIYIGQEPYFLGEGEARKVINTLRDHHLMEIERIKRRHDEH